MTRCRFNQQKVIAAASSLVSRDRKTELRSFIYGQSFTNPANFVKIGPVDVEIIGLIEITENTKKINGSSFGYLEAGWAKKEAKLFASEVPGEVVGSGGEEDLRCTSAL